jgi:glycosyltransferase involved in cell wall biosynthesis
MKKPLVSICCQTYNHANYIKEALEGFLMQVVDFNYEILLRDDASSDGTAEICKDYSKKYPDKIKLLGYKENQYKRGILPFADNVKRAKGKYIAICEGDDYWTDPYKLQKQVDVLEENPDLAMSTHEASHQSTLVDNEKNLRRFSSIFIRDIQLYGLKRVFYLSYLLAVNREQFWFQKRTHDRHKRKTISKLEDFKSNTWYMPTCSIVIKRKFINEFFGYYKIPPGGGHQLILLIGAMNGGIYHFKHIMAVKKDQESSVSKNKARLKKIKEMNRDPLKNNRIKRFKALQKCAKNKEQVQILQGMIDRELKRTKDNY